MEPVYRLHAAGHLTDRQLATAIAYGRRPHTFKLPPVMHGILHHIVVRGRTLMDLEEDRGWSARSAKVVLRVILDALEETGGEVVEEEDEDALKARELVDYLCGEDADEAGQLQVRFDLTNLEARLVMILMAGDGRVLSREQIMRRLYVHQSSGEVPDPKIVDVFVSKLRAKLDRRRAPFRIVTVWGTGYLIEHSEASTEADDEVVRQQVLTGRSMRDVARERGVQPSTIMRAVRRAEARAGIPPPRGGAAR